MLNVDSANNKQINKWANRTSGKVVRLFFFSSTSSYSNAIASNLKQTQYAPTAQSKRERFLFCCRQPSGCVSFVLFFLLRRWLLQSRSVRVSLSLSLYLLSNSKERQTETERRAWAAIYCSLLFFCSSSRFYFIFFQSLFFPSLLSLFFYPFGLMRRCSNALDLVMVAVTGLKTPSPLFHPTYIHTHLELCYLH